MIRVNCPGLGEVVLAKKGERGTGKMQTVMPVEVILCIQLEAGRRFQKSALRRRLKRRRRSTRGWSDRLAERACSLLLRWWGVSDRGGKERETHAAFLLRTRGGPS